MNLIVNSWRVLQSGFSFFIESGWTVAANNTGAARLAPSYTDSGLKSWAGYFETLATLFLLLGVLWLVLWLLKRYRHRIFTSSVPMMELESRLALGPKKWIVVLRFMQQRLVVGVTDHQISLLLALPLEQSQKEQGGSVQNSLDPDLFETALREQLSLKDNLTSSCGQDTSSSEKV